MIPEGPGAGIFLILMFAIPIIAFVALLYFIGKAIKASVSHADPGESPTNTPDRIKPWAYLAVSLSWLSFAWPILIPFPSEDYDMPGVTLALAVISIVLLFITYTRQPTASKVIGIVLAFLVGFLSGYSLLI